MLTGQKFDDGHTQNQLREVSETPPVPTTAIYTRADGVVAWQNCVEAPGQETDNIEVRGSHCGLGVNPAVLYAVADRLAQAEDDWHPFSRDGLKGLVLPVRRSRVIDLSNFEHGGKYKGRYKHDLKKLQERLEHILVAHIVHDHAAVVMFEGWDAAGKGGIIQRLTAKWDQRNYEVYPIAAPSAEEKAHDFLWRFETRLPAPGNIAVFDRSWYGRVLVERVEGLATRAEWRRGYDEINDFEAGLAARDVTLVKVFVHTTQEEQDKRLKARLTDPWKRWKTGADDYRNRDKTSGLSGCDARDVRAYRYPGRALECRRRQRQASGADRSADGDCGGVGGAGRHDAAAARPGSRGARQKARPARTFRPYPSRTIRHRQSQNRRRGA